MLHKARKYRQTILIRLEQVLGMPLDSPDETLFWHLDRFNEAVGSNRHRSQTAAEVLDSLVVQRIHFEDILAQ